MDAEDNKPPSIKVVIAQIDRCCNSNNDDTIGFLYGTLLRPKALLGLLDKFRVGLLDGGDYH